jgi:hypothetical protein
MKDGSDGSPKNFVSQEIQFAGAGTGKLVGCSDRSTVITESATGPGATTCLVSPTWVLADTKSIATRAAIMSITTAMTLIPMVLG